nr:hypothetical protein [Gemmatimonadota bacterium]
AASMAWKRRSCYDLGSEPGSLRVSAERLRSPLARFSTSFTATPFRRFAKPSSPLVPVIVGQGRYLSFAEAGLL